MSTTHCLCFHRAPAGPHSLNAWHSVFGYSQPGMPDCLENYTWGFSEPRIKAQSFKDLLACGPAVGHSLQRIRIGWKMSYHWGHRICTKDNISGGDGLTSDSPSPWRCRSPRWAQLPSSCPPWSLPPAPRGAIRTHSLPSSPNALRTVLTIQGYSLHWDSGLLTTFLRIFQAIQCFPQVLFFICSVALAPPEWEDWSSPPVHPVTGTQPALTSSSYWHLALLPLVAKPNPSQASS